MLSKLQLLYKLSPVLLVVLLAFAGYFAYVQYDAKCAIKIERDNANNKIKSLEQKIEANDAVIKKREQEKAIANIEIKKLQERLKDALKDNTCANEPIPSDVINWMRSANN